MKNRSLRALRARALLFALLASAAAITAGSATEREPLTLARAIELASTHGPAVASLTAERESLARRGEADALPPSAVIESDFENFAGTGSASGTSLLEATVRLSRVLELGGKADMRRAVGSAELEHLTADQQVRRTELAAEVSRRFIHVLSDQAMLVTARRATELARTARDVARERVSAGAASPATLGRADIALARAEIAQEHAEHELTSSRVKLSVLWGDTAASYPQAAGDLFELAELDSFDMYRDRLNANPELARLASEVQAQEARIKLAQAQRLPDVSVSAGVRRLETFDDQALVASFAVPLGTRRRAELQERAARADRNRIEWDRETRRLELHAALFELYQEILHARTEAASLHERIRPQAEAMLATMSEGYHAGRFSLLELADAQLQLIEVERDAIRAAAQFHTLMVEIQRAIGAPIQTLAPRSTP